MPTYTLITVTYGGAVHHARGFESLRMCQEARSIALTGMTIAENAAANAAYEECCRAQERLRRASYAEQWRAKHPPRAPTEEELNRLRTMQLAWRHDGQQPPSRLVDPSKPYCGPYAVLSRSTLGADGFVYDHFDLNGGWGEGFSPLYFPERGENVMMVRGVWVVKGENSIRSAHCVIELPDEPAVPLSKLTPSEAA